MKKLYRKEEGVSPVIATILMVAITVVLAATVYIMVAGMGTGGTNKLIANLTYKDTSNVPKGWLNLTISMSTPSSADPAKVTVTLDGNPLTYVSPGGTLASGDWTYIDLNGDGKISDGDVIVIYDTNIHSGSIVALSISGYSGNAQYTVSTA